MPHIGYEEFGRRFLECAAYEQRISGAFAQLTGDAFDFGPIGVGPARLAVAAQVRLGKPTMWPPGCTRSGGCDLLGLTV